jgi:hypothetical protein
MARQETALNVFISSPSDVVEDRDTVEEIIEEVTKTLSAKVGVRLVPLRWETGITPDIGTDPQNVINAAVSNNYDVFLGIMGSRFGEPTPRFGSGTEEEFTQAYEKHIREPNSLRVLFYFKDTPQQLSKIDPKQLLAVQEFKKSLTEKGVLFSSYTSREEFQKLLRLHLNEIVLTWHLKVGNHTLKQTSTASQAVVKVENDQDEELGIIDLLADIQDGFDSITGTSLRITTATSELGGKIRERTAEVNSFNQQPNKDFRQVKRICAAIARDMDEFCARLEPELKLFSDTHTSIMDRTIRWVSLIRDGGELKANNIQTLTTSLGDYVSVLGSTIESITGFRNSVAVSPRTTVAFNKSRNRTVKLLDKLIDVLSAAKNLVQETGRTISGFSNSSS